jgi:hypothetical protein
VQAASSERVQTVFVDVKATSNGASSTCSIIASATPTG